MALKEKKYNDAIGHMKTALDINKKNVSWMKQLLDTYLKVPELREESVEFWKKLIELEPANPQNYLSLAKILMNLRRKKEAVNYYFGAYRWSEKKNKEAEIALRDLEKEGILPEDIKIGRASCRERV